MSCLDDATIAALARGELSGTALEKVEAHVDGCGTCRKAVASALRSSGSPAAAPTPSGPIGPGTTIGRYLVIERVGVGAMGQVFSAYDPQLDRKVALKLLRPGASEPEHRARLAREAQTLARLSHPSVVTVFDVGTWQDQLFVALEFVADGSAREWLQRSTRSWRDVVALYVQAGQGLAAAHDAGVVHRDFKPDNVLVRADGRAQVTDFGLAAEVVGTPGTASADGAHLLSGSGAVLGTPAYMAPDQLEGAASSPASDQFSFCVSLFEALSGARPFSGESVQALAQAARTGEVRWPTTSAPTSVRRLITRGLNPNPQQRFSSMHELLSALEAASTRGRRTAVRLAIAATVALCVAALAFSARRPGLHAACQLAHDRHDAASNSARLERVHAAMTASGVSWAEPSWNVVVTGLNERIAAWRTQSDEACEALLSKEALSGPWGARLECLEDRWTELDATLDVLAGNGREAADRGPRVIERLFGPAACLHVTARARPTDEAPETVARQRNASERAAKGTALFELGKYADAEAVTRAATLSDGGLETSPAAVRFVHARALEEQAKLDEAQREFLEAGLSATRDADLQLEGRVWAELAQLVGYVRSLPDEGEPWALQADAIATATGDRVLAERVTSIRGLLEARRGRHVESERFFSTVERMNREREGERTPSHARALSNLAGALLHQGRVAEALPMLEASYRQLVDTLGSEHPDTFVALNAWGAGLGEAGRLDEAAQVFEQVLDGYRKTLGPKNRRLGTAAVNLAEARARTQHLDQALVAYQEAVNIWTDSLGPDAPQLAGALGGLGEVQLELHAPADAIASLSRAATICESHGCEPEDEGAVRFSLAKALLAKGGSVDAARAQGERAHSTYLKLGAPMKAQREAVEAWLSSVPGARRVVSEPHHL